MSFQKAQLRIFSLFFISLSFCSIVAIALYVLDWYTANEFTNFLLAILKTYSPHLGVILAGAFAVSKTKRTTVSARIYKIALLVGAFWNMLIVSRMLVIFFTESQVGEIVTYLQQIPSTASFLVTGALAYFFVSSK